MKVIIIGAVAADFGCGAKCETIKRQMSSFMKGPGYFLFRLRFPYHIGGKVGFSDVVPRTPASFSEKYGVQVHSGHEVTKIDPAAKKSSAKPMRAMRLKTITTVIMATVRSPCCRICGSDDARVFTLRTAEDTRAIMEYGRKQRKMRHRRDGLHRAGSVGESAGTKDHVTVLNRSDKITHWMRIATPGGLLRTRGVDLRKNTEIKAITKTAADTGEEQIPADQSCFQPRSAPIRSRKKPG